MPSKPPTGHVLRKDSVPLSFTIFVVLIGVKLVIQLNKSKSKLMVKYTMKDFQ